MPIVRVSNARMILDAEARWGDWGVSDQAIRQEAIGQLAREPRHGNSRPWSGRLARPDANHKGCGRGRPRHGTREAVGRAFEERQ
jgi:hypothetical protein